MLLSRRATGIGPPAAAIALAALWPLSAWAFSPLLFPTGVALAAIVIAVAKKPEYGLAIAIALTPLIGVTVSAPLGASITLPSEPFRYLVPLIVFGVLIYGGLVMGPDRRKLPGVFIGIVLVIGAALISTYQAIEPFEALPDIFLLITAGALFLAITNMCRTREQLLVVVAGALLALLIGSVHGIVQHFAGVFSTQGFVADGEVMGRVQGSFGHPNEYAGFLAMLTPLAVAVAATKELPPRLRLLAGAAAIAALPALNYSYARAAIATLVVGSLLFLLLLRPKLVVVTAVGIGLLVLAIAPGTLKERLNPESAGSDEIALRTDVAQTALDIYGDHPVFGVGINNFPVAYAERSPTDTAPQRRLLHNEQLLVPNAAPSQFLNTLAEQGFVGLGALVIFLLLALATAYRPCRSQDPAVRGLALGIGMGIAAMVLYSIVEVFLQQAQVLILFTMLAVAATVESAFRGRAEEPAPSGAFVVGPRRLGEPAAPTAL